MSKHFNTKEEFENTSSQKNNGENHNNEKKSENNLDDNLGDAPEYPPIFFAYDPIKKKLEVKDRRGNVITSFDLMTVKGKDAYEEWKEEQKSGSDTSLGAYWRTFQGKDGKSAYDLWYETQPTNSDRSETAYRKFLKGENGKSAFEQWKEVHGEYTNPNEDDFFDFLKGQDGSQWTINKDGYWCCDGVPTSKLAIPENGKPGDDGQSAFEAWQSLAPEARKHASLTDFFNWMVEQTEKKISAKEGATWIPNIVDGKVIFTNNRNGAATDAYPVKGKDGKSYTPIFVEGKLVFIDDDGREITSRHDYRGKSAFDLWQEQQGNEGKTLTDFFEFLKGKKGDDGLDGIVREAKHSYLEIKDHKCPVQTIDTALIANSSDSAKSPEEIVNDRIDEIENKRKDGSKVFQGKSEKNAWFLNGNWIYENWGGWFKEFAWWCAGADRSLLRMCKGDHSKYVGIGTVILFTALMAWFSSFIAMQLVFQDDQPYTNTFAAIFATFWAIMIFFLDRFITNTMYSDGKVRISKDEILSGLPRILIAIFLGIVISAPLELQIFEKDIAKQMSNDKRSFSELQIQSDKQQLAILEHERDSISSLIKDCVDNQTNNSNIERRLENLQTNFLKTKIELKNTYNNNVGKAPYIPKSNPKYKSAIDAYEARKEKEKEKYNEDYSKEEEIYNKEKKRLEDQRSNSVSISTLQTDLYYKNAEIREKKADIVEGKNTAKNDFENNKNGLMTKLSALYSVAMKEGCSDGYKPLFSSNEIIAKKRSAVVNSKTDSINHQENHTPIAVIPKYLGTNAMANQIDDDWNYNLLVKVALSALLSIVFILIFRIKAASIVENVFKIIISIIVGCIIGCNYEVIHYLWYFLTTPIGLIMFLFILIDISPVLYRMMLADGVYDNYLHQEELLKQDKIRLSLSRMLRKLDKGELKALSPFIMGKAYRKLFKYSIDKSTSQGKDYKQSINWGKNIDELDNRIEEENKKVFETVLNYKKRIILASYAAWYRDMRDALIGSPDDPKGKEISPEEILTKDPNFDQEHSASKSETESNKETESQESSKKEQAEPENQEGPSNESFGETNQNDNDE